MSKFTPIILWRAKREHRILRNRFASRRMTSALLISTSCLAFTPAYANDATTVPPIVISATRNPTPIDQIGSSMTLITSADIEAKQEQSLPDVLRDVPGLNVVQSGGEGGQTSVFMRGANSNHTKVLIDGIDVSDPSTPSGAFDFAPILASDIERVEVLRGPQSALYGSDAIGGVINIITKKGTGPAQFTASAEAGSFRTRNESAGVSGSQDRFNYSFNVNHLQVGAVPVTPVNLLAPGEGHHDDYHDILTLSSKLGANLTDTIDVGLVTRYTETDALFTADDDYCPFPYSSPLCTSPDPVQSESRNKEFFSRVTAHQKLFDGVFDQTFGAAYTSYNREDFIPNIDPLFNYGDRVKLDWQGNIKLAEGEVGVLGAEHQLDEIDKSPISAQIKNNAGFVELQSNIGERLFNALSVRYDNNDRFGGEITYRIAPAVLIAETDTKLKASYGTGFKAPTLNELFVTFFAADPAFNFYANPNLKPEKSKGYDFSFEQYMFTKQVQFGSTWFHNDIKNLIASNPVGTMDINIGHATTYGFENFASYKPWDALTLRADYTFTIAKDDTHDQELTRRPKNKASLNAAWQAAKDIRLTAMMLYVGPWIDPNRTVPRLNAAGYTTFNLAADYDIKDNVTLYGRIDNLLDHHYQNPVGFDQPGLGAYAGVKTKF